MPPFGNLYDLPTFVDSSLTHEDYIVFETGTHTEAIKLSYADYQQIVKPQIADLTLRCPKESVQSAAEIKQKRESSRSSPVFS